VTWIDGDQGNSDAPDSGAVIYSRSGGIGHRRPYLKASNSETGDMLGKVALSGNSLAVGAFPEDSNATGMNGNQAYNSAPKKRSKKRCRLVLGYLLPLTRMQVVENGQGL
jgi:hypothetical protein